MTTLVPASGRVLTLQLNPGTSRIPQTFADHMFMISRYPNLCPHANLLCQFNVFHYSLGITTEITHSGIDLGYPKPDVVQCAPLQ
jgi:hypothetical protein